MPARIKNLPRCYVVSTCFESHNNIRSTLENIFPARALPAFQANRHKNSIIRPHVSLNHAGVREKLSVTAAM